jgi:hypothetical protein
MLPSVRHAGADSTLGVDRVGFIARMSRDGSWWVRPERATDNGLPARVDETNGTYFSVPPFASRRFISARGRVSQA